MKNYFLEIWKRYKDNAKEQKMNAIEMRVNNDVVIQNDINDPTNKVYIFVAGVPIMQFVHADKATEQFFSDIKRMYRNKINNIPINNK